MHDISVTSHELLMARFRKNFDSEAFDQIVSYYLTPALAVARRTLDNPILAEDAVQEAFLQIIRKRRKYDPSRPFSGWFYTILRNICIDMLRRNARYKKVVQQVPAPDILPRRQSSPYDSWQMLQSLPSGCVDVLELRILHDLGFRDIAVALGISTEAAKKRAQRGLKQLREKIQRRDKKDVPDMTA